MKNIAILGATGSIGVNALEVIGCHPRDWNVCGLACGSNASLLAKQVKKHAPDAVSVADENVAEELKSLLGDNSISVFTGEEGLKRISQDSRADVVLAAVAGATGLMPAWSAVAAGKKLALATKEALVLAGEPLTELARNTGAEVIPVDSEHSAVFQLLQGVNREDVKKIWLGASGGPFRETAASDMQNITPESALDHPVWKMGRRITIDSATMMNKGLEIIEACRLFGVSEDKIGVFVHPQGMVHAMVELRDGTMLAHVGRPDMKGPIAYALYHPERAPYRLEPPDLRAGQSWTFEKADSNKFPCLELARKAARKGGTMPAVLNAADETAVDAFLQRGCSFTDIPEIIESVMDRHDIKQVKSPAQALEADRWARNEAGNVMENTKSLRAV